MGGLYFSAIKFSFSLRAILTDFRLSVFLYSKGLYFWISHFVFAPWCNWWWPWWPLCSTLCLADTFSFLSLCNIFVYFSLSVFLYFACLYFCVCKIALLYFAGLYFCILYLVFALWCNGGESGDHPAAPSVLLTLFFSQSEAGRGAIWEVTSVIDRYHSLNGFPPSPSLSSACPYIPWWWLTSWLAVF